MKQKHQTPIPSPAPTEDVVVKVKVDESGLTVEPDCVTVDTSKRVIWRFEVTAPGKTLDPQSVQFSFDRNRPCGPFAKIDQIEGTNDWVSTGAEEADPYKGYFAYNVAARLHGSEAVVVDPVIYNHGKPPDNAGEAKDAGDAPTESSSHR